MLSGEATHTNFIVFSLTQWSTTLDASILTITRPLWLYSPYRHIRWLCEAIIKLCQKQLLRRLSNEIKETSCNKYIISYSGMPRVNRLEGQYNVKVFENEKTKGPKHDGQNQLWAWGRIHLGLMIYIYLKIKSSSVRIRSFSCQICVLRSTGFELTPLIHCSTNRLVLCLSLDFSFETR